MRIRSSMFLVATVVALTCSMSGTALRAQSSEPVAVATAGAAETSNASLSWNGKPPAADARDLRFAVVSDNSGGLRPGIFRDAMGKLNLLRPTLVMCVGDLIEGYSDDDKEIQTMWDEFAADIAGLDAPFFGVTGNHDVSNEKMTSYLERRFGPTYYSFVYGGALFLVLNSQDNPNPAVEYRSGIGESQVEFAKEALAAHADVRWTFVFMHQPLFVKKDYPDVPGWGKIEGMLAARPHTVFAGHWHEYARHEVNGHVYYRLGTTGGASQLRGAERGELDQVVWVTMTKDGPVVANLDLKGIYPDDVSTDQTTLAYESINSNSVVKPISIVIGERVFTSAKVKVEVVNGTDFPLAVKAEFAKAEGLTVEPARIEASVKPHVTETTEVSVAAAKPVDSSALEPIAVEWSARYDVPGRKPIEGKGKSAFLVEGSHACRKAGGEIKADGDLSDWSALPERLTAPMEFAARATLWEGPADASVAFATAYDDEFVYLAFSVTDDRVVIDDEHNARQEDALTVLVDARPAGAWAQPSKELDKLRGFFVISPGAAAGKEELGEPLPEGAKAASVITPTGYNTEIAIPVALLDKAAGGPWKEFRLNIRLHDLDTQNYDVTLMWWRPIWDKPLDYSGSGTFRRE